MTTPTFLPPERVREIEYEAWQSHELPVAAGLRIAAPEIARAVLEMAAMRLERKAAELQIAKQTDEVLLNRAVRLDDADILRQMAKEIER